MQIRIVDYISDEERKQLFKWGEDIFGVDHLNLRWKPKDLHLFVEVDGRAVTHVGLLRHSVAVGERAVNVCGVGGVVTARDEHDKGYATYAMRHAAGFMRQEMMVEFGLLFCLERLVPFYERLSWQQIKDPVEVEQPDRPVPSPLNVMILPCGEDAWPSGPVKLNSFPW
ncbi:MAG: GNAT family N-acetyltransferase [Acidobacteria bacterium]|nr:GNAT family N-acetyltransferase [Acidobacteriota bacterium]